MPDIERDAAAEAALARAIHRAWPARTMGKFAAGWSRVFLIALRGDPDGRAAIAAALLDEAILARALDRAHVFERTDGNVEALAREVLSALRGPVGEDV